MCATVAVRPGEGAAQQRRFLKKDAVQGLELGDPQACITWVVLGYSQIHQMFPHSMIWKMGNVLDQLRAVLSTAWVACRCCPRCMLFRPGHTWTKRIRQPPDVALWMPQQAFIRATCSSLCRRFALSRNALGQVVCDSEFEGHVVQSLAAPTPGPSIDCQSQESSSGCPAHCLPSLSMASSDDVDVRTWTSKWRMFIDGSRFFHGVVIMDTYTEWTFGNYCADRITINTEDFNSHNHLPLGYWPYAAEGPERNRVVRRQLSHQTPRTGQRWELATLTFNMVSVEPERWSVSEKWTTGRVAAKVRVRVRI